MLVCWDKKQTCCSYGKDTNVDPLPPTINILKNSSNAQTDGKWACIDNVRAHLHFPCSMLETKCEPQVIKFSLSPQGGCQCDHPWPSYNTAIWSQQGFLTLSMQHSHCHPKAAVNVTIPGLHHQAIFRDSDAPSVWSCNQCKINFWLIESNIFRNNIFPKVSGTEVDTTSCILFSHSF